MSSTGSSFCSLDYRTFLCLSRPRLSVQNRMELAAARLETAQKHSEAMAVGGDPGREPHPALSRKAWGQHGVVG